MDGEITLASVPQNTSEFLALRDQLASTPQGGAAVFVAALLVYASDTRLGLQCLTIAIDLSRLQDGSAGIKGKEPTKRDQQSFRDYVGSRPYLARSYVQGTSPENGYELAPPPLRVRIKDQPGDLQPDKARVFVYCTGADSPRPIRLSRNASGTWKASEWSSLLVGIRPPASSVVDDI
jgi:hypothetical protein